MSRFCAEPGVFGLVASDPTVSRLIAALAVDAPKALAAIASARGAARAPFRRTRRSLVLVRECRRLR
jgi:hypothetical protein